MTVPSSKLYTEGYLFARLFDWSPLIAAPGRLAAASRSQHFLRCLPASVQWRGHTAQHFGDHCP